MPRAELRRHLLGAWMADVLPRIVADHRASNESTTRRRRRPPTHNEIRTLANDAVAAKLPRMVGAVTKMARDGLSLTAILRELVSPAARLLGEQWQRDDRSFVEVTAGGGALQSLVTTLTHRAQPPAMASGLVVLVTPPKETHSLGVAVLAGLVRQRGWNVRTESMADPDDLVALVAREPVRLLGISIAEPRTSTDLGDFARLVKERSVNPEIILMLGGIAGSQSLAESLGLRHGQCADDIFRALA